MDRRLRVFRFQSGKLRRVYNESLEVQQAAWQQLGGAQAAARSTGLHAHASAPASVKYGTLRPQSLCASTHPRLAQRQSAHLLGTLLLACPPTSAGRK